MSIEDPRLSNIDNTSAADDLYSAMEDQLGFGRDEVDGVEVAQAQTPDAGRTDRLPAQPPVQTASATIPSEVTPNAQNVVTLPAGIELDNLEFQVDGENLVLVLDDGTQIVVVGGAANIPTFVIGDVELPQVALFAALEGSNINVAAGPDGTFTAQSTPGNSRDFDDQAISNGVEQFGFSALLDGTDQEDAAVGGAAGFIDGRPLFGVQGNFSLSETVLVDANPNNQTVNGRIVYSQGSDFGTIRSIGFVAAADVTEATNVAGANVALTSAGVPVVITASADGLTLTGAANGVTIFTLTVTNVVEGFFTFTLSGPVDNPGVGQSGINDLLRLTFNVTIADRDGDTVTGNFAIDIADDAPTVSQGATGTVEDEALVGGNNENEGTGLSAVATGSLNVNWGADNNNDGLLGDRSVAFTSATVGVTGAFGTGLSSMGEAVSTVLLANGTLVGYTGSAVPTAATAGNVVFFVTLSDAASGSYTFTLVKPLDHAAGSQENTLSLTFGYRATDSDGDSVTSNFVINVVDDAPVQGEVGAANPISEDDVSKYPATDTTEGEDPSTTGSLGIRWGADNNIRGETEGDVFGRTVRFFGAAVTSGSEAAPGLAVQGQVASGTYQDPGRLGLQISGGSFSSAGHTLSFQVIDLANGGQSIIAFYEVPGKGEQLDRVDVFKITLDPTAANGSYKVELFQPLDHDKGSDSIRLSFGFQGTDSDGDSAAAATASVVIADDAPVQGKPGERPTLNEDDVSQYPLTDATPNRDVRKTDAVSLGISWGADDNIRGETKGDEFGRTVKFFGTTKSEGEGEARILPVGSQVAAGSYANPEALGLSIRGGTFTSGGKSLYYVVSDLANGGQTLTAYIDGSEPRAKVFEIVLDPNAKNGSYTVEIFRELDHTVGSDALRISFKYQGTDADGDSAAAGEASVRIRDDQPVQGEPGRRPSLNEDDVSNYDLTDATPNRDVRKTDAVSLGISWGADDNIRGETKGDEFGRTVKFFAAGKPERNEDAPPAFNGNQVAANTYYRPEAVGLSIRGGTFTSGGKSLYYVVSDLANGGQTLTAYIDGSEPRAKVFEIVLDPTAKNGSYTVEIFRELDHSVGKNALQIFFKYQGTDADGDSAAAGEASVRIRDDEPVQGEVGAIPTLSEDDVSAYEQTDATQPDDVTKTSPVSLGIAWGADDNIRGETKGDEFGRTVRFFGTTTTAGEDKKPVTASAQVSEITTTNAAAVGLSIEGGNFSSGGRELSFEVVNLANGGQTLTAYYMDASKGEPVRVNVFQIVLDPTSKNGSYTLEIFQELDHNVGSDSIKLSFAFQGTDADGDSAKSATAAVIISDDQPLIGQPFQGGVVEEEQWQVAGAGNEDGGSLGGLDQDTRNSDNGTTHRAEGTLAISWGADDANSNNGSLFGDRSVQFTAAGIDALRNQALTSDGVLLKYTVVTVGGQPTLIAYTGTEPTALPADQTSGSASGIVFTVSLSDAAAGKYVFNLYNTLDHKDSVQGEDTLTLNFQFTATDADGDVSAPASFGVKIIDDAPTAQGAGPRYVEEEALPNGNEDASPLGVEWDGVTANGTWITNAIGASLNIAWGGDDGNRNVNGGFTGTQVAGDRSVVFATSNSVAATQISAGDASAFLKVYSGNTLVPLASLTSEGQSLVYSLSNNGSVLTAKAGETVVFTVTLSDANNGSYNFNLSGVLDHPVKGDSPWDEDVLSFNFTFTARDGDGDVVRQGFQVNVIDDSPVIGRAESATVEDEAVNNGNNENDGLSKSATGSLAIYWGADDGNNGSGGKGDRSVAFTNANVYVAGDYGDNLTSLGQRVYTAVVDGVLVAYTGGQNAAPASFNAQALPANVVFYVTLSDASDRGSYTFNLVKPLDHAAGRGENELSLTFNFTATDSDGDKARDTFTVNVRDDVATITPPATAGVVEEEHEAVVGSGNEDTTANGETPSDNIDADTNADPNVTTNVATGGLGISWGADNANDGNGQPGDRSVQFADTVRNELKALGLTSDGVGLSYKILTINGQQTLLAYIGNEPQTLPSNPAQAGIVFSVALSDSGNGQYTFTLFNTVDHKGSVQGEDTLTLSFKYTATDSDGDVTQPASFSVKLVDDVPVAGPVATRYVEEEVFANGNKETEGKVEADASQANGGPVTDRVTGASLNISWGGDDGNRYSNGGFTGTQIAGDRSVIFEGQVGTFLKVYSGSTEVPLASLTSAGQTLYYSISGNGTVLTARAGSVEGPTVFIVKLSDQNNGSYDFELKGVLDHPVKASGAANEDVLSLNFTATARDGDGDKITTTFAVGVIDDSPMITSPEVGQVEDEAVNGGNNESDGLSASVVDRSLGISWGADNANNGSGDKGDRAVFFTDANVQVSGGYTSSLTSLGQAVQTTLINGVLVGYTGAAPASFSVNPVPANVVFYASLSDTSTNGSYNFTLVKPLDHAAGNGENELTLTFNFTARDSDGDTASSTFQVKVVDDILAIGTPVGGIVEEEQREVSGRGNEDNEGTDDRDTAQNPDVTTHRTGGSLDINWGSDKANDANGQPGDRSVVFSTATVAVADAYGSTITSLGEAVKTAILSNGTLIGYTGNSVPSSISSDRVVFYATVSDADPKGSYSFTLVKPLDHKAGEGENQLTLTFRFTATDSDGDTADGSFTVKVIDDIPTVPTSVNAAYRLDDEGQGAIAIGNPGGEPSDPWPSYSVVSGDEGTLFRAGADGVSSITINGPAFQVVYENRQGFAETESVTWGSGRVAGDGSVIFTATSVNYRDGAAVLVIRPDGSYSFQLKAPVAHSGAGEDDKLLSFGYTVTDGDGDAKSGTLNINVNDDTPTAPSVVNAAWVLDDEAQWGVSSPNYLGPNDVTPSVDEVWGGRGTLFSAGSDGVKSITIEKSSFDVIFKNAQGFAEVVTVTWGAGTVGANGTVTFKATNATYFPNGAATLVIRTDGSYVLDLDAPIAHQTPGTREEDATLPIRYTVTDGDGDVKSGTLNIFVNDDTPRQDGDATTGRTLNEDDLVGGNDSLPREPLSTTGDLNVSFGSDGVKSFALSADNANWNEGTRTLTAGDNSWTISVAADGTYRFTLLNNTLAHGQADNGENTLDISVRYVVTDGDGDQISGNFGIRIVDDVPVATSAVLTGTANELLVADGNPATPEVKGFLSSLVSFGADGAHATNAYTVETRNLSTSLTSLTSNGIPLTFTAIGNVMTARAGEVPVFTFSVNAVTGEYTFTQVGPLDHIEKVIMDGQGYPLSVLSAANAQLKVPYVGGDDFAVVGRLPNGDVIIRVTNDGNSAVSWNLDNNSVSGDNLVINLAARQTVYVNVGNIAADPIVRFDVDGDNAPNGVVVINRGTPNIEFIDGRTSLTLDLSSAVTVRDGDGDTLALSNQLKITVTDSTPSAASNINGEVFEDGNKSIEGRALVNWNADNGPAKTLVLNGNPSILDARGNTVGTLYSNSQAVAFTTINGVLIGYIAGKDAAVAANRVFTLSLDAATGSYSFTLLQPLDHTEPNGNDHFLTLGFTAVATDGDRDVISVPFTVKVDAAGTIDGSSISYGNVSTGVFVNLDQTETDIFGQEVMGRTATDRTGNNLIGIDALGTGIVNAAGGSGHDIVVGNNAANILSGGDGWDVLVGKGGDDILEGGKGDDFLQGDDGNDTLRGGDGNDVLSGGRGNDVLEGGAGDDMLIVSADIDDAAAFGPRGFTLGNGDVLPISLAGRSGEGDSLSGGTGIDTVSFVPASPDKGFVFDRANSSLGLSGIERFTGTDRDDIILLPKSYTTSDAVFIEIDGGEGNDILQGSDDQADKIIGGMGNDWISGLGGNDDLDGGEGNDQIWGGAGNDTIRGREGNDTLVGGAGNDVIEGGAGNDRILYTVGDGDDIVDGGTETGTTHPDYDELVVGGDATARTFTLGLASGGTEIGDAASKDILVSYAGGSVRADEIERVTFNLGSSGDTVVLNSVAGSAIAPSTIVINGGLGNDTIDLSNFVGSTVQIGDAGGTDSLKFSNVRWQAVTVTKDDNGQFILNLPNGTVVKAGGIESFTFENGTVTAQQLIQQKPSDIDTTGLTIAENSGEGASVGSVKGTDANGEIDPLTYAFVTNSGVSQTSPDGRFTINATTGAITVAAGASIDYETEKTIDVTIRVTDSRLGYIDEKFTINVTDVNEAPTAVGFSNVVSAIDENIVVGSDGIKVADITVTDDALGTNQLSLAGDDAASFRIVGNALYFVGTQVNYEAKASYSVSVQVNDTTVGGTPDATQTFTLNVNNRNDLPTSTNDSITILEDTATPLTINDFGTFKDEDAGQSLAAVKITALPSNGTLQFQGTSGWTNVSLDQEVSVNDIIAGKLQFVPALNANGADYATIGFKVGDGTAFSDQSYSLKVNVTAQNDAPVLSGQFAGAVTEDFGSTAVQSERVVNGNFSGSVNGAPAGWQATVWNPAYTGLITANGSNAYSFYTQGSTTPDTLAQTISTQPGTTYEVKFQVGNAYSTSNALVVTWGGETYLALPNITRTGSYNNLTEYSFRALATSASTELKFSAFSTNGSIFIDNVSVLVSPSETAQGVVNFTDADIGNSHSVAAVAVGSGYVGTFRAVISDSATTDGSGKVSWRFNVNNSDIQHLAQGQELVQVYAVTVSDGAGGSKTENVSVTITGTNDVPVISVGSGDRANVAIDEANAGLITSGTLTVTDVDVRDVVTASATSVSATGNTGGLTNEQLLGYLNFTNAQVLDNTEVSDKLTWNFNSGSQAFDFLAAGQTLTLNYVVRATDNSSGAAFDDQTVTITITGTNDRPVISGLDNVSIAENQAGVLIDTFQVSDVDTATGLTFRVLTTGGAVDPRFEVVAANGSVMGRPGTYELRLKAGQSFDYESAKTASVTVEVNDQATGNNITTQPVTITVTDVVENRAPIANNDTLFFGASAGTPPSGEGWTLNTANGHYYKVVAGNYSWDQAAAAAAAEGAYLATITSQTEQDFIQRLATRGQNWYVTQQAWIGASDRDQEGNWTWVNGPEAGTQFWTGTSGGSGSGFQNWRPGEPNDSGATEDYAKMVIVAGGGWNDGRNVVAPVNNVGDHTGYVAEWSAADGVSEDKVTKFSSGVLTANDTDPDGDTVVMTGFVVGNTVTTTATTVRGATVTFDTATGEISYDPTNASALQGLNQNETLVDWFTYSISDGKGGTATATAMIKVNGANELLPLAVNEATSADGRFVFTDDNSAYDPKQLNFNTSSLFTGGVGPLTYSFQALPNPNDSWMSRGANVTGDPNPGQSGLYLYKVTATDTTGASVSTYVAFTALEANAWRVNVRDSGSYANAWTSDGDLINLAPDAVNQALSAGAGHDVIVGNSQNNTIVGSVPNTRSDTDDDMIFGMAGDDTLSGGAGWDFIDGGDGNDTIYGDDAVQNDKTDTGSDVLLGGAGNDTIYGGRGSDVLVGGTGVDRLYGESGDDLLIGDQQDTVIDGGESTDTLQLSANFTSTSDAHIVSVERVELTNAAVLNLSNQTEGFKIVGSSGNDTIIGGGGQDIIAAGAGNDRLTGNGGADHFRLATNTGTDTITDFSKNAGDTIALLDDGYTGWGSVNFSNNGEQLNSSAFSKVDSLGSIGDLDNRVIVVRSAVSNMDSAILSNADRSYIVVYNSNLSRGEIWYSDDWGTTIDRKLVAILENVSLQQIAALERTDFVAYSSAADPIILDLDKNGFAFSSLDNGVTFDINADGHKDQIAWTKDDGILAYDVDGNGTIDNGSEIFTPDFNGGKFASGVAALASLDSNADGKIDGGDAAFKDLKIWVDANNNGVSDEGELSSLSDKGVASISLTTNQSGNTEDGQKIFAEGEFTFDDGSIANFVEVGFDTIFGAEPEGLTLHGGMGQVVMSGSAGADTFVFDGTALDQLDVADVITDFNGGEGDVLDVTALLDSLLGAQPEATAETHLRATLDGAGNTTVSVQAEPGVWKDVVELQNHDTAIKVLFDDKHTTITPHD